MARNCAFCEIAKTRDPQIIVRDYGSVLVIRPRGGGVTPGHLLFIPTFHVSTFYASPTITRDVMEQVAAYTNEVGIPERYGAGEDNVAYLNWNVITSAGAYATQTISHFHVHLVPRRLDDGLKLPWSWQCERSECSPPGEIMKDSTTP